MKPYCGFTEEHENTGIANLKVTASAISPIATTLRCPSQRYQGAEVVCVIWCLQAVRVLLSGRVAAMKRIVLFMVAERGIGSAREGCQATRNHVISKDS